jgi:hypothetical protein
MGQELQDANQHVKQVPQEGLSRWSQGTSLIVIGLGVGWLTGLSVSPVVSGVIAALLGIAGGIVTGLRTPKHSRADGSAEPQTPIDARPAALLVVGVVVGATLGILVRTHHVLEPYDNGQQVASGPSSSGVLFAFTAGERSGLMDLVNARNHAGLVDQLQRSSLPMAKKIVSTYGHDPNALRAVVMVLCEYESDKQTPSRGS